MNTDISILAGHSLLVTEKENVTKKSGHYVLKKANSMGYRTTTSRLFSSVSTEECVETNDTAKVTKQTKQRLWSLQLFGVKVCKSVDCLIIDINCSLVILGLLRIKQKLDPKASHVNQSTFALAILNSNIFIFCIFFFARKTKRIHNKISFVNFSTRIQKMAFQNQSLPM